MTKVNLHDLLYDISMQYNIKKDKYRHLDIKDVDMEGLTLSEIHLDNITFIGCNLKNMIFSGVDFHNCIFIDCNLSSSVFDNNYIEKMRFNLSNLSYVMFMNIRHASSFSIMNMCNISNFYIDMEYYKNHWDQLYIDGTNLGKEDIPMACPSEGEFIGYKKAVAYIPCDQTNSTPKFARFFYNDQEHEKPMLKESTCVVKLLIPNDAKRSSSLSNKCRCSKAKVLGIYDKYGNELSINVANSSYNKRFVYKIGEMVTVDNFDENRFKECSTGIHFFMSFKEAAEY